MAISTFAELKTALDNFLITVYDDERKAEFIALAEPDIIRRLMTRGGIRDMEVSADVSWTASGGRAASLPTRFRGARRLYINTSPIRKPDFLPPNDYWSRYLASTTGPPEAFTIEGDEILLGPAPDDSYTGKLLYFQGFPPLSDSATTNDLLANNPDAYLFGALRQAWIFKGDAPNEVAKYEALLNNVINQMIGANKRDRFGGAPLVQRTDTGNPPRFSGTGLRS